MIYAKRLRIQGIGPFLSFSFYTAFSFHMKRKSGIKKGADFGSLRAHREAMLATMVKMRPMTMSKAMKMHIQRTNLLRMLSP